MNKLIIHSSNTVNVNEVSELNVEHYQQVLAETKKTVGGYLNDGVNPNPVNVNTFDVSISI